MKRKIDNDDSHKHVSKKLKQSKEYETDHQAKKERKEKRKEKRERNQVKRDRKLKRKERKENDETIGKIKTTNGYLITKKAFKVGNPMYHRIGGDTYSYRLNKIIDKEMFIIEAGRFDFDRTYINDDEKERDIIRRSSGFFKIDGNDRFSPCSKNDKGNWVFRTIKKYRGLECIYLLRSPIRTSLDPGF